MITTTKKKLLLKRLGSVNNSTSLYFAWMVNGQYRAYDSSLKSITEQDVKDGKKEPKLISFPANKAQEIILIDENNKDDKAYLEILQSCPSIKCPKTIKDGIMKNPQFELIDVNSSILESVQLNKKDKVMMNFIDSLSIEDMCAILNYLGYSVVGLTAEEVYDKLINRKNGLAYDNYEKIMNMNNDFSSSMKVNINKAISLGKISHKGGVYYYKENPLGNNIDQIITHFNANNELYKASLLPDLENEMLPIAIGNELNTEKSSKLLEDIAKGKEILSADSRYTEEYVRKRADELDIKSRGNMKFETLRAKVIEREQEIVEWQREKENAQALKEANK